MASKKCFRYSIWTTPLPRRIFFLIWIICQLDSVLVNFLQIDKESKYLTKSFFFFFFFVWGGGVLCVCVCGGGGWT